MTLTILDMTLGMVWLISGMLGMARGLIRQIVLLCCIPVAMAVGVATPYFTKNPMVPGLAILATALGCLFGAAYVAHRTLDNRISQVDRTLGLLFGLLRGFIPVAVGLVIFEWLTPQASWPAWIRNALSLSFLEYAGQSVLTSLAAVIGLNEVEPSDRAAVAGGLLAPLLDLNIAAFFLEFVAIVTRGWRLRSSIAPIEKIEVDMLPARFR
jgi:uncharacterized membrane protein required for colicin V production